MIQQASKIEETFSKPRGETPTLQKIEEIGIRKL